MTNTFDTVDLLQPGDIIRDTCGTFVVLAVTVERKPNGRTTRDYVLCFDGDNSRWDFNQSMLAAFFKRPDAKPIPKNGREK